MQTSGFGFITTQRIAVGRYQLLLSAPPADVNVIAIPSLYNQAGYAFVTAVALGIIAVTTLSNTLVFTDLDFAIIVVNGT